MELPVLRDIVGFAGEPRKFHDAGLYSSSFIFNSIYSLKEDINFALLPRARVIRIWAV